MIYFDNAATSFPKPKCVVNEVTRCITRYCGNPGRSGHDLSIKAADKIYSVRESIADFFNYKTSENVIFAPSATYALNLVIKGSICVNTHCIVSDAEHNSVLRPLYKCATQNGTEISLFDSDKPPREAIIPLIKENTKFIISTLCSNVTGKSIDLKELSIIAKENGLGLIIDASQLAGHYAIDLCNVHFTAMCCAGHKGILGIQGGAFLIVNEHKKMKTLIEGGSGLDTFNEEMPLLLPERYEAGTLATPAIVSMGAGIDYIKSVGINTISEKIDRMTQVTKEELSLINSIKIYGAEKGIVSFNVLGYQSSYVSRFLNDNGIATRSGFHCAPTIHKKLNTEKTGAIRVSLSFFNNERQIHSFIRSLRQLK